MDNFCRACLVRFDELTSLHQYSEKNRRLFVYATGLQVKRNDNMVFQICNDCYNSMKNACAFKKNCRNADKKIKSYFVLKEDGESVDFCSFLKNNDETVKFRLPLNIGNSTPAKKDDDNESTCTSIQNFMTDILQPDEIPDNEARIIREVIEEEADILEDSLDSSWLQDDVSMDTNYQLDFSFSPFSTPRVMNDDHCYTPIKQSQDQSQDTHKNYEALQKIIDKSYGTKDITMKKILGATFDSYINNEKENKMCSIDFNIENALKNEKDGKFPLDVLLATPPVRHDISGPPTPLITNILFGDKVDNEVSVSDNKEEMDVLDEFLSVNKEHVDIYDINEIVNDIDENIADGIRDKVINGIDNQVKNKTEENNSLELIGNKINVLSPPENKYCVTNFYCKMCNRQFKNLKALKIHCAKHHKFKIKTAKVKYMGPKAICDYCGKIFASSRCIVRHIENHMKPSEYTCQYCSLKFSASYRLKMHLTTHTGRRASSKVDKRHVCSECGRAFTSTSNYRTHMKRHGGGTTCWCTECGMGFYRNSDLAVHMRRHTGEQPFQCVHCPRSFARLDSLNRHTKRHTGEKPFNCGFCNKSFTKPYELKAHQSTRACLQRQLVAVENQRADDQLTELLTGVT